MANAFADVPPQGRELLIAGIDWGGGGSSGASRTVLVIGFMRSDYVFQICRLEKFPATEDPDRILDQVAKRCQEFRVQLVDDLPLESTGKFRPSRSLVHSRYDESTASVAGA